MRSASTRRGGRRMPEAMPGQAAGPLLDVRGLSIGYRDALGRLALAADGVSFSLAAGEALGIVGESGSGKSTVARALLGYYRGASERAAGEIVFAGRRITEATPRELAALRGVDVAFVPQNPLSSLTYHIRVGDQLVEILRSRAGLDAAAAKARALELFAATRLPQPEETFRRFPHQLSGGQRQRVVIACALACRPKLLVLDEPTTALDKTTETQVLDLVQDLRAQLGAGLVLVTHDLNVVASLCDHVVVMKDGRVVERGTTAATFGEPSTDYTRTLVGSMLHLDHAPARHDPGPGDAVLEVADAGHRYRRSSWFRSAAREERPALAGVTLSLRPGEIAGVIGESGSGKSTLGAMIAGLIPPTAGSLRFCGGVLGGTSAARTREERRRIQIVFQDPLSSLNPRRTVGAQVARPIEVFFGVPAREARARAAALLGELGLGAEYLERFPRQLSGGQQQRVAVARAFAAEPDVIVCDEITSALDATVQGQVLAALVDMQKKRGTAMLVISHDLAVIWSLAQHVLVLRDGVVHEQGDTAGVFSDPRSDYTRSLLQAATRATRLAAACGAGGAMPKERARL